MELQQSPEVDELQERVKLRREARRKKILENAKSRLEKLSMKQGGDGDSGLVHQHSSQQLQESCEYSDPEVEPDIPETLQMPFQQFENTFKGFESSLNQEATQERENPFLKYKLHVVLAVTVAYITSLVLNESEGKTFFVIIPVALVIISDLTIFRQQKQRNPVLNMLVIFGLRSQEIVNALDVFSKLQNIMADLSIFIFYFCLATCFGNQFVHLADIK
ncbi:uncharacterized protein LOC105217413 [Zeugodacus cucurbitae]|uniref:uncharacterized protein LOC105217413 n=1 Tax=Zeugodacus cucurbitae TaxID=28588 RepID=UPI0005967A46|nr:uncharacterized protein LOC105217413 [Zeugodacus cucurbitae]